MSFSYYNIKKWAKMLTGKSLMHVAQEEGRLYKRTEIKGYYNDLTLKVINDRNISLKMELPYNEIEDGRRILFPIQIFQYGLGCYDLYLDTLEEIYLKKFFLCVEWALNNQMMNGAWDNFSFVLPDAPYSSMCQGEGCSLLARAFIVSKDNLYKEAALKAIDYMLLSIDQGGTCGYKNDELFFYEYTNQELVLNGWIFSLFGLYDAMLLDEQKYRVYWEKSISTLKNHIEEFDSGKWTLYQLDGKIASPFYHRLHISQLKALSHLSEDNTFLVLSERWAMYYSIPTYRIKAFIKKAYQKVSER